MIQSMTPQFLKLASNLNNVKVHIGLISTVAPGSIPTFAPFPGVVLGHDHTELIPAGPFAQGFQVSGGINETGSSIPGGQTINLGVSTEVQWTGDLWAALFNPPGADNFTSLIMDLQIETAGNVHQPAQASSAYHPSTGQNLVQNRPPAQGGSGTGSMSTATAAATATRASRVPVRGTNTVHRIQQAQAQATANNIKR